MSLPDPFDVAIAMARQAHDLGIVHYQPTGQAPTNLTVPLVVFGRLPATPVRAVAVNVYDVDSDLDTHDLNPLVRIQWRFREPGDDGGRAVNQRAHAFFAAMHTDSPGAWPGGIAPAWCYRTITGQAQADTTDWERPDSYEIRYNPGAPS